MPQSRKTRRDKGHRIKGLAGEGAMQLLAQLWCGDTLDADDGVLRLIRKDTGDVWVVPTGLLDELELTRGWIKTPVPGEWVTLTTAVRWALEEWMGARYEDKAAAVNARGDRIKLRRA